MERWILSHPDMLPCDTINHRLSRFQRGYVPWWTPGLYPSRFLTQLDYATPEEQPDIWLQNLEYNHLYGGKPNRVFRNYTSNIQVDSPC